MDLKEQLKSLSAQDRKELLKQLQQEEKESSVTGAMPMRASVRSSCLK